MNGHSTANDPWPVGVVCWDTMQSPLGTLYVAMGERGLCRISFDLEEPHFVSELQRLPGVARVERSPAALAVAVEQLRRYFAGQQRTFDLPLDLSSMTPFQQEVLRRVCDIPAGQVMTYGEVAAALGRPRAGRAVGQALRRNPLPLVVPCHRVVGHNGSLRGYGGLAGVETKRVLLEMEGGS